MISYGIFLISLTFLLLIDEGAESLEELEINN
jgi:hypothetical protein